ncbi:MAG: HNH endonuclease [Candidatus Marinimicrobia bacterium]|nr:HNH endonuclease [Candidatus Neomarinimicrobiota bacterium]
MYTIDNEIQIRLTAIKWLEEQKAIFGKTLPRKLLENGFIFNGERITLIGARGIWKPKQMVLPISITTSPNSPYNDDLEGPCVLYKYRGTDPNHSDNKGLREIMKRNLPLIYFIGTSPGNYYVESPVFIRGENRELLSFRVVGQEFKDKSEEEILQVSEREIEQKYSFSTIKKRLHQPVFSERVMYAYNYQCTMCRLKHRELLEAAHIIPDSEGGEPIVPNGLSLCKIHHAAYDKKIIGISPDYTIKVREDILRETDGPMLKHGIQELDNHKIILPYHKKDWPDPERLEERFQAFKLV